MAGARIPATLLAALVSVSAAAAETNLWANGDCEEISVNVKAASKSLMRAIRSGWMFDFGPVAFFPKGWWPNGQPGEFRAIDASEDDSQREFVHSGKAAFYIVPKKIGKGMTTGIYNQIVSPAPGKYEISFWTKGDGVARLVFANYDRERFLKSENYGIVSKPSAEWTKTCVVAEIGQVPGSVRMSPILIVSGGGVYVDDFSMKPVK